MLRQSHTVGSSKPLPPKFFVGHKTLTTKFKKEKRKPSPSSGHENPHPRPPPPPVPIHTCTSSSASMHGTAYRSDNHLARRLLPPPGCRQTPSHFTTSTCRCLSPSSLSTLLAVEPARPVGESAILRFFFSWTTR